MLGCNRDEPPPECPFVVDEVGLDERVATPNEVDVVPRDLADVLAQGVVGELEWDGADNMEWIGVVPGSGTTQFTSSATLAGPVVWSRVPDATGDELLRCAPTLAFDVVVDFETADGVFDDTWSGAGVYDLLSLSGTNVDVDAEAAGIPETLDLSLNPDPPQPLFNPRYKHSLLYGAGDGRTRMEGAILFRADFEEQRDGEIIDGGGVNLQLATWSGEAE